MEILEETLLVLRCNSFWIEGADTISHPRYYFFDPGVLNGLLHGFDLSKDRTGMLFEHAVVAQIQNSASATHTPIEVFFFRTRNGIEVDFIVKINNKIWAIEAKHGDVSSSDAKSLEAFRKYLPSVNELIIVIPSGPARKLKMGVLVMSVAALIERMFVAS